MRFVIKNAAPSDSRREKWGDYHFGRSLTKYLVRLGHEVETHYDPGWGVDAPCDVVLVLRGKYPFPRTGARHDGALRVMWNISHPADVSLEEYETYDLVLVASQTWAERLRPLVSPPVHPFLQCTDAEEFFERPVDEVGARRGTIFVGNTREVERPAVLWALEYGLPVSIWGRGWGKWLPPGVEVEADYVPNEALGALYSSARATLNDHWDDMKEYGFVNNRIFDALACGLPVVSDWHPELQDTVPGGVLFYRDRHEFERCMETLLLEHPRLQAEARAAGELLRRQHSFERRAHELVELVSGVASQSSPASPSR